jgi:hypothetical protein
VIPRKPIPTLNAVQPEDAELIGKLFLAAAKIAAQEGIAESGYRTLINCNAVPVRRFITCTFMSWAVALCSGRRGDRSGAVRHRVAVGGR